MNKIIFTGNISGNEPLELISRLREILSVKKNISIEKQDEAGRLVALSAIQFQNENSNEIAFDLMALIYLAKIKGVKEAKKRTVNLSRWLETEPPFIGKLKDSNERIAAIKGLSSVEFPWAINYIQSNFLNHTMEEDLATAFVMWGKSSSKDLADFIIDIYVPLLTSIKDAKLFVKFLKESPKFFIPYTSSHSHELAIAINKLSIAIIESLRNFQINKKEVILINQAAVTCLTECWQYAPPLLLQPNFVNAYKNVTSSLNKYKKIPTASFNKIESATINLIIEKIPTCGDLALKQLLTMRKQWEETYPNFQKLTKILSKKNTILNCFLENNVKSAQDHSIDPIKSDSVFSALLPAWDRYKQELNENEKEAVETLTVLINKAANNANIESFGERGQLVYYDPLSHNLNSDVSHPPLMVRIIRPGVLFRRPDQSIRVLIQAFTSAE
jgi:hypothetical protein